MSESKIPPDPSKFNNDDPIFSVSYRELCTLVPPSSRCSTTAEPTMFDREFELVTSYNWLNPAELARRQQKTPIEIAKAQQKKQNSRPTIVVPGAPKRFLPWKGGTLKADETAPFADENRYFMPDYPLEPLVQALLLEGYDPLAFHTIDVITDRDNLRRLFEFCKDRETMYNERSGKFFRPRSFRINLERVGQNLVLFEQYSPVEHPARQTPIYGQDFENRCTKEYSFLTRGSYYGIVKYKLGGLTCLVRSNIDCAEEYITRTDHTAEDVTPRPINNSKMSYMKHGPRDAEYDFVEVTTKRVDQCRFPEYLWDQLYFGCAKSAYIGWHDDGHCQYPQLLTLAEFHKDGRMRNKQMVEKALRGMCLLIQLIIDVIRKQPAGERYVLEYEPRGKPDSLMIYRRPDTARTEPEKGLLPEKLKQLLEEGYRD